MAARKKRRKVSLPPKAAVPSKKKKKVPPQSRAKRKKPASKRKPKAQVAPKKRVAKKTKKKAIKQREFRKPKKAQTKPSKKKPVKRNPVKRKPAKRKPVKPAKKKVVKKKPVKRKPAKKKPVKPRKPKRPKKQSPVWQFPPKTIVLKDETLKHRLFEYREKAEAAGETKNPYGHMQLWNRTEPSESWHMGVTVGLILEDDNLLAIVSALVKAAEEVSAAHNDGMIYCTMWMHEYGSLHVGSSILPEPSLQIRDKSGEFSMTVNGTPGMPLEDFEWGITQRLRGMLRRADRTAAILEYAVVRSYTPK